MIIKNFPQGSADWHGSRVARPSASQFKNIVTSTGAPSKSRKKYMYQLAGERVTGKRDETYQSYAMTRGIEIEPEARNLFVMVTGIEVNEVGLCIHDSNLFSCSPDGLMQENNMGLEIKCPSMAVHIEYLIGGRVPVEYYQQVHGSMLVTGYDRWYFMSYYPGLKPFIHLEKRNDEFCEKLETELKKFCAELDEIVDLISQ
jgi:putative phage-type endonuclease